MKTTLINKITILFFLILGLGFQDALAQYEIIEADYNSKNQIVSLMPAKNWQNATEGQLPEIFQSVYNLSAVPQLKLISEGEEGKFKVLRYQQFQNGFEVEGGEVIVVRKASNGQIYNILGRLEPVSSNIPGTMPESEALKRAINHLGPDRNYLWKDSVMEARIKFVRNDPKATFFPKGKLVYFKDILVPNSIYQPCYLFEIYPEMGQRMFVYVNAANGVIVSSTNAVHKVSGSGETMYNGNQGFTAAKISNTKYFLHDSTRKIFTLDAQYTNAQGGAWEFEDTDGAYAGGNQQKSGSSAHWGAFKTYDYYKTRYGRNSWDGAGGAILQFVNYRQNSASNYGNAFWDGVEMCYGDGGGGTGWNPVVAMDDVGHELTHAYIEKTANLKYYGEPGALNEAWADILGMAAEAYAGDKDWTQSEDSYSAATDLRNMADPPNSGGGAQPDTYTKGAWKSTVGPDDGGVHTNSGVANYWFYLITDGGKGTNDNNDDFDVKKLDLAVTEKIAWVTLSRFMVRYTDYAGARKASLLACEALGYDKKSDQYKAVCEAWFAVGVGNRCCDSLELEFKVTDTKCHNTKDGSIELTVKELSKPPHGGPFNYKWYKGDTTSALLSTSKNLSNRDSGTYVVLVYDSYSKCQFLDKTKIESPEKLELEVAGGGTYHGACERSFTVTLSAGANGGTYPYIYSWPNGILDVTCGGATSFTRKYTCYVMDDNNCVAKGSAIVKYIAVTCSYDPNDIIGPPSYGDPKWVSVKATLPYKIRYENDPKFATGPAQKVTIDHDLDTTVDLTSFRLGDFGFYKYNFTVPNNTSSYTKRLDLRDSFGIYLDVVAGIDVDNHKAFWVFESIDPKTGLPPTDGNKGFLGINDTISHKGEGFANYTIKPRSKSKTGDSIRAKAVIVFDDNPPVNTPRIHNLIDAVAPTSNIKALPSVIDSTLVRFHLKGQDDAGGSGLGSYDIYVSENNAAYKLVLTEVTDSIATFNANFGSTYRAYSLASDNTLNREANKKNPDVTFSIASKYFFKPIDSTTSLCAGDTLNIRWFKSFFSTIDLEYSADSGKTYTTFATGLDGNDTLYRWPIPNTISGVKNYFIRSLSGISKSVIDTSDMFQLKQGPAFNLGRDTTFCDKTLFNLVLDAGSGYSTYKWSDNSTNQTFNATTFGTFGVLVTASTGCKAYDELTISKYALPTIVSKDLTHVDCFNGSTGSIDLVINLGSKPYKFNWNSSDTTEDLAGIKAGQYIVTITDTKGCSIKDTSLILQPSAPLSNNGVLTHVGCYGNSTGAINLTVSGGTPIYTFAWTASGGGSIPSGQSTSEDLSGLSAGSYTVTVTDSKNCTYSETFVITQPSAPLSSSKSQTNVTCFGLANGSIDLSVSGGTSNYTYTWSASNGGVIPSGQASNQDLTGLVAGTYNVVITDKNGCTNSNSATITQPSAALSSSRSTVNVLCFGNNTGSIDLTVAGGTTAYTYSWTTSAGGVIPSGQANAQDLSGLVAGTYSVIVTDANNCTTTNSATITQPSSSVSSSKTQVNVLCFGNATGSIDLTVAGGTAGYSYSWTASSGGVVPSGQANSQDLTGLVAGTYSVTITDANGCTATNAANITQPSAALSSSKTQVNISCFGLSDGSIDLSVSGGTAGYTYAWTASSGGVVPSGQSTAQDLSGLLPGVYSATITDANACKTTNTTTITQPSAALSSSRTFTNVLCFGNNTGSIDLTVTGGTVAYSYAWTASGGGSIPSGQSTSQDLTGLIAGNYSVTIKDANGCVTTNSATISQPASALGSTKSQTNVLCFGLATGAIDLTVSGGTAGYTYLWTASGGGSIPSGQSTSQDLTGIVAGTYSVTVTDANGCTTTNSATITQPSSAVSSSKSQVNVLCFGNSTGSIDLTPSGGTPGYTYVWTASAGGVIPSGQTNNQDLTGLVAGTYNVTVRDANNCTTTNSAVITQPSAALASSKSQINVLCFGNNTGSIDLTVTGGTPGYTYAWSASNGGSVPSGQSGNQDLTGLVAGTYAVTVTDANNCTTTNSAVITQPAAALGSSKTQVNVLCFGSATGSIDLTVAGGTAGYTYSWTASGGGSVPSGQAGNQDLTGLVAGTYNVTITDANSCTTTNSATITQPAAALNTSKTQTNVLCFGNATGAIDLTVGGGTASYTYLWTASSGGIVPSGQAGNQDLTGLVAGTYSVLVTDANGCTTTNSATITQPAAVLTNSKTQVDVLCFGNATGAIDLTVNGGTNPYFYLWTASSGGVIPTGQALLQDLSGLVAGTYSVAITDNNGCTSSTSVNITQPLAPLALSKTHVDVLCYGNNTGSIDITLSGGTIPYSYSWSSGESSEDISSKITGKYKVVVTDKNLCVITDSVVITQPAAPLSNTLTMVPVNCFAGTDGSTDLNVAGGTTPYTFLWSNGKTTEDLSGLATGSYSVIVTDANACKLLDTILVTQPAAALSTSILKADVKCFGGNDGSANLSVNGGTTPYSFVWSNGATTEDISSRTAGKYLVTITDKNLCVIKDSVVISQPLAPLSSTINALAVNCFGGSDGSVTLNVLGGTIPYTYSWSNGASTKDITALSLGKYKVVVTDFNNCILKDSIVVSQPAAPLSSSKIVADAKCNGSLDGSVNLSVNGGTTPYTFSWSNAQTTEDIVGLGAGKYVVTITDKNLCKLKDSAVINHPTQLVIAIDGTTANLGVNNGKVWVIPSGATPPYSYVWSNGGPNNDTIYNVGIGSYIVTVTDANGCQLSDTFEILEAPKTEAIKVFPNPSRGFLTVTNLESFGLDLPIYFELYDLVGKLQMSFEVKGQDVITFNLDDGLYNNSYILRMRNERFDEKRKVFLLR